MATFGDSCEPLKGDKYGVIVEVEGELTDVGWVFDLGALKEMTRDVCKELDHKFLLQRDNMVLKIDEGKTNWKIRYEAKGWVFPKEDVIVLPIENSTAEQLAKLFAERIRNQLEQRGASNITSIAVGVEEMPGQAGWYREG